MGTTASACYGHLRRFVNKYNASNRAYKFLEKEKLPSAPKHPIKEEVLQKVTELSYKKPPLEDLHKKDVQLNEYLKKVYLTSTIEKQPVESKRPLPIKRVKNLKTLFYEPESPEPGFCTLTQAIDMILKHQEDPKFWTAPCLAAHYKVNVDSVVQLLTYHSFFKIEKFEFMNQDEPKENEPSKIDFEVFTPLEKKPVKKVKQIESK